MCTKIAIWNDPDDEVLECKCEPGNSSDPYAVAVLKEINGADNIKYSFGLE